MLPQFAERRPLSSYHTVPPESPVTQGRSRAVLRSTCLIHQGQSCSAPQNHRGAASAGAALIQQATAEKLLQLRPAVTAAASARHGHLLRPARRYPSGARAQTAGQGRDETRPLGMAVTRNGRDNTAQDRTRQDRKGQDGSAAQQNRRGRDCTGRDGRAAILSSLGAVQASSQPSTSEKRRDCRAPPLTEDMTEPLW